LHNLTPHVYWTPPEERTDRPVLGAVAGQHATLMVDAGNSPAHVRLFLDGLAGIGASPPRYVALTHWHWDHTFGLQALDAPALAHAETRARVLEMAGWEWSDADIDRRVEQGLEMDFCRVHLKAEWPDRSGLHIRAPDVTFTHEMHVDLGGVTCRLIHVGGDHSSDSCVIHVPEDGVAFVGDCLYENLHHSPPYYTTARLFPLLERVLGLGAAWYLIAHNPQPTPRAELEEWASDVRAIGSLVDRLGANPAALLAELPHALGRAPTDDDVRIANLFIAGLQG
jgi:glyoxylase-like metal-dependent hydrolase (beta-lactamase superfamily II)